MATQEQEQGELHVVAGVWSSPLTSTEPREVAAVPSPPIGDSGEPVQSDDELDLEVGTEPAESGADNSEGPNSASTAATFADVPLPAPVVGLPCSISSNVVHGIEQDVARFAARTRLRFAAEHDPNESTDQMSLRCRRTVVWIWFNSCSLIQHLITLANMEATDEDQLFLFFTFLLLHPQVDAIARTLCLSTHWGWPAVLYLCISEIAQLRVLFIFCEQEKARTTLTVLTAFAMAFILLHQYLTGWKLEKTEARLCQRLRSTLAAGLIRFFMAAPAICAVHFMDEAPYRTISYMIGLVLYYWLADMSLQSRGLRAAGSKSGLEFEKKMMFQGMVDVIFLWIACTMHIIQLVCAWLWFHHPSDKELYDTVVAMYLMAMSMLCCCGFCCSFVVRQLDHEGLFCAFLRRAALAVV